MAQRRLVLVRKDRLGQRLEQRHEPLQAVGQRPRRDRQPLGGHPRGNAVHGAEAGTVRTGSVPRSWSRRASWGTAAAPRAPTLPWATTRTRRSGASADGGSTSISRGWIPRRRSAHYRRRRTHPAAGCALRCAHRAARLVLLALAAVERPRQHRPGRTKPLKLDYPASRSGSATSSRPCAGGRSPGTAT